MNPAPMPWILWGPGLPPDSTGDSEGSTATSYETQGREGVRQRNQQKQVSTRTKICYLSSLLS